MRRTPEVEMDVIGISPAEVLKSTRHALGLSTSSAVMADDAMLAASLRRAAGMLCPCSLSTLTASVLECLQYLMGEGDNTADRVSAAAEGLLVIGDLLELNQVTIDDPAAKATWVFPAPPGFIVMPSGSVFLVGIVPDEVTPLPASLTARIISEGFTRSVTPQSGENLASVLSELGLRQLSVSEWLKAPRLELANTLRDNMVQRLAEQPPSGAVADILILDPVRSVGYYVGRWVTPTIESGNYVARRPQAYGAPLWGFASLVDGIVTKFLDFPLKGSRWRGCDMAWHLQMAIDHGRRTPQLYRRRPTPAGECLDFFSPLPLWAHRRLSVIGRPAPREKSLISYSIPEGDLAFEEKFLQEHLWLAKQDKSE
jgi:hypothetical protein